MALFKISCIELFGLPSSGKSYLIMNDESSSHPYFMNYSKAMVKNRCTIVKIINLIVGLVYLWPTLKYVFFFFNKKSWNTFYDFLYSYFRLLERVGDAILRKNVSDEGIIQALWGVVFRIEPRYLTIRARITDDVLNKIDETSCLHYAMINKRTHQRRYTEVTVRSGYDAFDFANHIQYAHGRNCMSLLLRVLRKRNYEVKLIKNN